MSVNYIDTHCHLDVLLRMNFDDLLQQREIDAIGELIQRAERKGVTDLICVGTNLTVSRNAVALANYHSGVWATIGLHPTDAHEKWRDDVKAFKQLLDEDEQENIVGIGETGIDLLRDPSQLELQKDVFKAQIELALEHDLPLVLHIRDQIGVDRAAEHALGVLEGYGKGIKAVLHCFQQSQAIADEALARGFFLGVDAPIDYPKNEWLRNIIAMAPLEKLVLETDAPFLPPQALRGTKNVPEAVVYIASKIAELKGCTQEHVAATTTANARRLFSI